MKAKRRSRTITWVVLITLAGVAIAASFLLRPKATSYESVVAKTEDITTYYSFAGNVGTKNRQTVMSEKVMQIATLDVKEGDAVKVDEVLIKTTTGDEIRAKINGVVVNVSVAENAQVMAGVKLLEVVDNKNLEIKVKVDEYDIKALAIGKETTVKIGAIDKEIKGKVKSISEEGQIENGVTFFIATIDLAKNSGVKIGMSAEVTLISDKVTDVVTLPMAAIQFNENNKPYVLKKDEKGAPVKIGITTGINNGTIVEVKRGVSRGETILYPKATRTEGMGFGGGRPHSRNDTGGGS